MTLTQERLLEVLHYDPDSGIFTNKISRGRGGKAGAVAGSVHSDGYIHVMIDGRRYYAHRLAHLFVTGEWPQDEIDHRDLDRANNRWANLRPATRSQNIANSNAHADNRLGVKGVVEIDGRYRASIYFDGRNHSLGSYSTAWEAGLAYATAAENAFGEFARVSSTDQLDPAFTPRASAEQGAAA